ncbi:S-layer homology domain-containing protein [Marinicrinis sediminis]|uniref:S-layer homology domain-containing protein n=1 Tax=Marinicrinis sediminis TaxID=1652465 RepID=A0ABW5R5P5_9BACL
MFHPYTPMERMKAMVLPLFRSKRNSLTLLVMLSLVLTTLGVPGQAASDIHDVQETVAERSKADIAAKWQQYKPMQEGMAYMDPDVIYKEKPSLIPSYSAGEIKKPYILDGINATNFVRYLAGLPDDIEPDWTLASQQQTAALVNAVNDELTHYPDQPAGMSQEMFELGKQGTSSSNLYAGSYTFYENVRGYMSDSDPSNIDRVGHRRWILHPIMQKTMFGMVHREEDWGVYASMYAFDFNRPQDEIRYSYISWPSAHLFPNEFFSTDDAWSISLNTLHYDNDRTDEIAVKLTRVRDGHQWHFDASDTDKAGKYFNVNTANYGDGFAIIFRPDDLIAFQEDEAFRVDVTGLYDAAGRPSPLSYTTTFFNLLPEFLPRWMVQLHVGETIKIKTRGDSEMDAAHIRSDSEHIVRVNGDGTVTAVGEGEAKLTIEHYLPDQNNSLYIYVEPQNPGDQVSAWAYDGYMAAKSNGIVMYAYDHRYQSAIDRFAFVDLVFNLTETILGETIYLHDVMDTPFIDVDDWRVNWAYENQIISGVSNVHFEPYSHITREQAASLIMNTYRTLLNLTGHSPQLQLPLQLDVTPYADEASIASWATSNVYQVQQYGFMSGVANNRFDPKGKLTFEQTYLILQRLFELFDPAKG